MNKKKFGFMIAIVLVCILSACQQTPKQQIVIYKGNGAIQAMIETSNEGKSYDTIIKLDQLEPSTLDYDAPQHIEKSLNGYNTAVNIDADVIVTQFTPAIISQKGIDLSYDTIKIMFEELDIDDADFYSLLLFMEPDVHIATKDEIEFGIESAKDQLEYCLSFNDPNFDSSYLENVIKMLLIKYEDAPETIEEAIELSGITGELAEPIILTKKNYLDYAEPFIIYSKGSRQYLTISNNRIHWSSNSYTTYSEAETLDLSVMNNFEVSSETAQQTADDFKNKIDSQLFLNSIGVSYEYKLNENNTDYDAIPAGYVFIYRNEYAGVEDTKADAPINWMYESDDYNDPFYAPIYYQEELKVTVGINGIIGIEYASPAIKDNVLAKEAALLPFDEIEAIIDSRIIFNGLENREVVIEIYEIRLGMMRIKVPEKKNHYITVPVWDCLGYYAEVDESNAFIPAENLRGPFQSFLTINAIDGSIINRKNGY